ncbi:hypothetical protein OAO01_00150 [Oligoflexia bacterium]|nr:hypothetical protein [Oligoflexia bacterium]
MLPKFKLLEKKPNVVVLFILAALFGYAAVYIPGLVVAEKVYTAPLFPLVRTAVESISVISVLLLFLIGAFLGVLDPDRPLLLGFATMTAFPVLAIIEKTVDITSHTHFPLEFLYYVLVALAAVGGAYTGRELKKK